MVDPGYSLCPFCNCWIPADDMCYDRDDEDNLIRMCRYCTGEKEIPEGGFVRG